MATKRSPQQLLQIADTKTGVLRLLDTEGPLNVQVIRDRLKLQGQEGVRLLETALKVARDVDHRAEQVEGKRGVWRSVRPGQQPLPVGQQPAQAVDLAALTGLKAETVEALRAGLLRVKAHPDSTLDAGDHLGAVLAEAGEIAAARTAEKERLGFLYVATVALRAYEAMS